MLEHAIPGGLVGSFIATVSGATESASTGIFIFAVGILVGLACVRMMDWRERHQMRREYEAWVAAGRPNRRVGERRGPGARRGS